MWRGASDVFFCSPDMERFYEESDLDFNIPGQTIPNSQTLEKIVKETAVLEGWVVRDGNTFGGDGLPRLFLGCEPYRLVGEGLKSWDGEESLRLPRDSFPAVTWESEPKKIRILLEPIE